VLSTTKKTKTQINTSVRFQRKEKIHFHFCHTVHILKTMKQRNIKNTVFLYHISLRQFPAMKSSTPFIDELLDLHFERDPDIKKLIPTKYNS